MVALFNLARLAGALLLVPPDVIGPHLFMMAPLPQSIEEARHRRRLDQVLESFWGNVFEIQPSDEWIVDGSLFDSGMDRPSTYGEVTSRGARQLFRFMCITSSCPSNNKQAPQDVVFWDLGSGAGKLVVQSYLELPRIQRSVGIELAPTRHETAVKAWESLVQSGLANDLRRAAAVLDHTTTFNDTISAVELLSGDLFQADLSEATHIYVASLCFPVDMMQRLEAKLAAETSSKLECVASLKEFPQSTTLFRRSLPRLEYVEMSWTKPRGNAVYLYNFAR